MNIWREETQKLGTLEVHDIAETYITFWYAKQELPFAPKFTFDLNSKDPEHTLTKARHDAQVFLQAFERAQATKGLIFQVEDELYTRDSEPQYFVKNTSSGWLLQCETLEIAEMACTMLNMDSEKADQVSNWVQEADELEAVITS